MGSNKSKKTQVPVTGTSSTTPSSTAHARNMANPFEEMERMFSRMMGRPFSRGWLEPFHSEWPAMRTELPRVDVVDRDREIMVRAEVPGVAKDDLEVTMSGNTVTFRGATHHEQEKEEGEYHYRETSRGEFCRTVTLPADVDSDHARAKYKDGMVELVLPKLQAAQRKKVNVEEG